MKTYQKLLGASCLALCLVGCRSGESPVEMVDYGSQLQINSKVDSVTLEISILIVGIVNIPPYKSL